MGERREDLADLPNTSVPVKTHIRPIMCFIALSFVLLLGCNLTAAVPQVATEVAVLQPVTSPTFSPLFDMTNANNANILSTRVSEVATPTPFSIAPTRASKAVATATNAPPTATPLPPLVIYDEGLHPDWELVNSDIQFRDDYAGNAYSGNYAIRMNPAGRKQVLWFTLKEGAARPLLHSDVLGVTFQLYSGENGISNDALGVAVIGSKKHTYWVPNDDSVIGLDPDWEALDTSPTRLYDYAFPPTRLYFLGITNDIPPNTWIWVTNWFEDRSKHLEMTFITGMYIRTDIGFHSPVLIDDVKFIYAPPE